MNRLNKFETKSNLTDIFIYAGRKAVKKIKNFGLRQRNLRTTAALTAGLRLFSNSFASSHSRVKGKKGQELRANPHEAEPHIVVTITRRVVVAITGTQVLRIVVPTTATYDAVRARNFGHYTIFNEFLKIDLLIESELTCSA